MNDIKRQYKPIEAKRFEWGLRKLKTKSLLKTLKITMLLAIIVGMPLWAISGQYEGMMLITGAILLGVYVVAAVTLQPDREDNDYQAWVDGYRYDYSYHPGPREKED